MSSLLSRIFAAACALAGFLTAVPAGAQTKPAAAPDRAEIEESLAEIADDTALDEAVRTTLTNRYSEALRSLDAAASFRQKAAEYEELLEKGTENTAALRRELETLEKEVAGGPPDLPEEALENPELFLAQDDARLVALRSDLERQIAALEANTLRPDAARQRLEAVETDLTRARERLSKIPAESPSDSAEAVRTRSEIHMLEAEAEALRNELKAQPIRQSFQEAEKALTEAKIVRATRRVAQLQKQIAARNAAQADTIDALLERLRARPGELPPALAGPVEELERLAQSLRELGGQTTRAEQQQKRRQRQLVNLRESLNTFRKLLELGNLEGEFAEMFLQVLRQLPARRTLDERLAEVSERIATTRRKLYLLQDTEIVPEPPQADEDVARDLGTVREKTGAVKTQLEAGYNRLISQLTALEETEREYAAKAEEFRAYATEKLFWVRSSPIANADSFRSVPAGLAYCYGPGNLAKLFQNLADVPLVFYLFMGAVGLGLAGGRRYFKNRLAEAGRKNRRISTNRFANTLEALALTLLLALPLPLAALTLALGLGWGSDLDDWSAGLRAGLIHSTVYLMVISLVIESCRPDGLGKLHFGWPEGLLRRCRKTARWSMAVFVPAAITLGFVFAEGSNQFLNGLGRWTSLALVLGLGLMLANILHQRHGLLASVYRDEPANLLARTRKIWPPLIYLTTGITAVLLLLGYIITAIMLVAQLSYVILTLLAALFLYALVVRWLSINERRLALEQAVAERKARFEKARESAAEPDKAESPEQSLVAETQEDAEPDLDLSRINEHSRRLLRFVISIAFIWALYLIWTGFAPVTRSLDEFTLIGNVTVRDLLLTVIVITLSVSTVRNLPGLLEGLVFSKMKLTSGGRHTAITLGQYLVMAVGATFLFRNLGIDWSQFAWIAAALGVGIGFGLQEVVANFISGLILLFERPIRVGDVVTVDGVDGVVTKIQIRATTITGWDRREFIVPNKNFVTGTLLNWTLSNPVNRVEIAVGAAYGSDTERARELLLEAAAEHPNVLDDPGPIASFEGFGDSTLNLVLRAYLPDMDNRLSTFSELHTAIDRKFKAAGIEIAFPQLDIHFDQKAGDDPSPSDARPPAGQAAP